MRRYLWELLRIAGASLLVYALTAALILLTFWALARFGVEWRGVNPAYILTPCVLPGLFVFTVLVLRIRQADQEDG